MVYYVDLGADPRPTSYMDSKVGRITRATGQYVVFPNFLPLQASFRAKSIVTKDSNGAFLWYKNTSKLVKSGEPLNGDDEQSLMLQILQSEVWL